MTTTTDPDSWERIFEQVGKAPGSTKQQPAKKTVQALQEEALRARRQRLADVALTAGMVDDGEIDPFDWLAGLFGDIDENITANTEAIVSLQDVAAAQNVTAAYLGDMDQMVSVSRDSLKMGTISGSNTPPKSRNILDPVEFVYSGVYHHSVLPVMRPGVVIGATEGDIIYTPITSNRAGTVEGIAWVGGGDTSIFSIDYYNVALCVYNPATGNIEKAWDSGDIKDAEASVSNPDELYKAITTEQVCSPGQVLFAAHQQIAPGVLQTARTIGASPEANISRNSAPVFDAWCFIAEDHSQGIPSSISLASLTRENRFCPWFGLRVAAVVEGS